ncbi:MAG TPA: hypothetical protein PKC28_15170, partial [Bdellovibrionales bacterium]|nr:hypothetical protein [Bdellovibrionales bacterium]
MKTKAGSFSKLLLILAPVFGAFVSSPVAASSATCISHLIYEQAVSQERLPVVGALPEELIAKFDRLAGTGELLALLADDLKVRKIRYGRVTKIVGGTLRVRTLVLQRGANGQALLALMRAMLEEKQRQLRFEMRPHVFIRKMDEFAARLEAIAYPALGALDPALLDATRERVGWTRFTLRAILGASTSPGRLWPLSQEDAIDHLTGEPRAAGIRGPMAVQWSMTRLLYAARAAIL